MTNTNFEKDVEVGLKQAGKTQPAVPVIRIALSAQVDGGRNPKQMSLETYVAQDVDIVTFDAVLDTMRRVLERQTACFEVVNVEDTIQRIIDDADLAMQQVSKIDERIAARAAAGPQNGRRDVKPPENELANRQMILDKIAQSQATVASHHKLLAKLRTVIDGRYTDEPATNNSRL